MGLMCEDDSLAVAVVERLGTLGVDVPEEVAVLGVNNDDIETQLCPVPLSSIDPGTERVGYEAAAMAAAWVRGVAQPPEEPTLILPLGVVARRSTEALAVADERVRELLRRVRSRACDADLTGDALFERIPLSRRTLEKRFKEAMGHTVWEEVRRLRVERAKTLLASTDMPVGRVASRGGVCESSAADRDVRAGTSAAVRASIADGFDSGVRGGRSCTEILDKPGRRVVERMAGQA